MDKHLLPPRASSLSESMRNIGYSLESAIADIVDNSITAKASKVEVLFDFNAEGPILGILDNGIGMDRDELISAMQYGFSHPKNEREDGALGRFGLGLKTASLSQCRELTVISRKDGVHAGVVWDLDKLQEEDDWVLGILDEYEIQDCPYVDKLPSSGTLVLWRNLDRLYDEEALDSNQNIFRAKIRIVEKHLSLVFHRFLAAQAGKQKLDIYINEHQVESFNPFCAKNKATQLLPEEKVKIGCHSVLIRPYILPHHSKLSKKEYNDYFNRSNFADNQGLYIYRERRLIAWGDWFRLVAKSEATKLARIRVDFPNFLDEFWKIDIKKSQASLPDQVMQKLRLIINKIKDHSTQVHINRGKRLYEKNPRPLWIRYAGQDGVRYALNREHPIIEVFKSQLDVEGQKIFLEMLSIIEDSIPIATIYSDYSSSPKDFENDMDIGTEEVRARLSILRDLLLTEEGLDKESFREVVSSLPPFCEYPEKLEQAVMEVDHVKPH